MVSRAPTPTRGRGGFRCPIRRGPRYRALTTSLSTRGRRRVALDLSASGDQLVRRGRLGVLRLDRARRLPRAHGVLVIQGCPFRVGAIRAVVVAPRVGLARDDERSSRVSAQGPVDIPSWALDERPSRCELASDLEEPNAYHARRAERHARGVLGYGASVWGTEGHLGCVEGGVRDERPSHSEGHPGRRRGDCKGEGRSKALFKSRHSLARTSLTRGSRRRVAGHAEPSVRRAGQPVQAATVRAGGPDQLDRRSSSQGRGGRRAVRALRAPAAARARSKRHGGLERGAPGSTPAAHCR